MAISRKSIRRAYFTKIMEEKEMSGARLAQLAEVNHSYISRIISGDRDPGLRSVVRIARVLEVPLEEIVEVLIGKVA